jgi:cell division transport system permease protein
VTFRRALAYFFREAATGLVRSWKVSLVAVATIAVSLFVGGVFLVVGGNLAQVAERAKQDVRVVVYFDPTAAGGGGEQTDAMEALAEEAQSKPWVRRTTLVSAAEARQRFVEIFPGLAELLERDSEALPPSVEIGVAPDAASAPGYAEWLDALHQAPGVSMVDDDREWIGQLRALVAVVRGLGLALGGILLGAAVFTIGSVIRLTTYLYEEEITIMRLVGATEFFIRGPFYTEGLIQGFLGGAVAAGGLWVAFQVAARRLEGALLGSLALAKPPSVEDLLLLAALGAAGGLIGAIISLRGENLGEPPIDEA